MKLKLNFFILDKNGHFNTLPTTFGRPTEKSGGEARKKPENVVRHLPKEEQAAWRTRLQRAYQRPTYVEATVALHRLQRDLETHNQSAARSLAEGLEETLP